MKNELFISIDYDISLLKELNLFLSKSNLTVLNKSKKGFDGAEVINYFLVGGGLVSITKVIVDYVKIKASTRKVIIETKQGDHITIEGQSLDEVKDLLSNCYKIFIDNNEGTD